MDDVTTQCSGCRPGRIAAWLLLLIVPLAGSGCTSLQEWFHNGFLVGPNYQRPPVPLAPQYIDAANPQVKSVPADYSRWWEVFDDPQLNALVKIAYQQNVNLRVAGTRVLEARAQRAIAVGELFPQQQAETGSYTRVNASRNVANPPPRPFFDNFAESIGVSWEIDFWGKIRRLIESADDAVAASVDDYDNVMVTLIGDLATAYVQYRLVQQQIVYTEASIEAQRGSLKIATAKWKGGNTSELSVAQATSLLEQLESTIPVLETTLRQLNNQICVLLGMPPTDLSARLGQAPIPVSPPEVIVGIPADLIRRRPDLRSAERLVAAQNAQIGVAEANYYPAFFITGTIGVEAKNFSQLFSPSSVSATVGPSFQWAILNYGRILNNVRFQDFKTQELAAIYQQKVLLAAQEVEGGIVTYLDAQRQLAHLSASVKAAERAYKLAEIDFKNGLIGYNPVFVTQQFLIQQEVVLAQARGEVALGLITVYRALGGGWELRLQEPGTDTQSPNTPCAPGTITLAAPVAASKSSPPAVVADSAPVPAMLGTPEALPAAP